MSPSMALVRRELKQTLREPIGLLPHLLVPALLILLFCVYFAGSGMAVPMVEMDHALLVLGLISGTLSLALCADAFAGEKERNTWEILLALPLPMSALYWGKIAGILPLPLVVGWVSQVVLYVVAGSMGFYSGPFLWEPFIWTPVSSLFLVSVCTLISLKASTVRGAAQLSGLVALAYLLIVQVLYRMLLEVSWGRMVLLGCFVVAVGGLLLGGKRRFEKTV